MVWVQDSRVFVAPIPVHVHQGCRLVAPATTNGARLAPAKTRHCRPSVMSLANDELVVSKLSPLVGACIAFMKAAV